jgi:transposase
MKDRPSTIVQEDNAPAHAHQYQTVVYNLYGVLRLLWPANSPDLNAIEKAWPWLKRVTTARGCPKTRKEMEITWAKAWASLP